jgi:putative sterol carrier protein
MDGNTMTVEPLLRDLIDKFNVKADNDEALRSELEGMDKKVLIDLGSEIYNFHLHDGKAHDFKEGRLEDADLTLLSDPETFQGIIEGKIKPMKAFALRKVRVKGDISDVLKLRKLF